MQIAFFTVPIRQGTEAAQEVNHFLRAHRILHTDRRFVEDKDNSFWALAIEYLDGQEFVSDKAKGGASKRVDYKEILDPKDFEIFSRLREVRKQIAAEEAVPVYIIFTNEQLAKMVTEKVDSKQGMQRIKGVGEATRAKYGDRILEALGAS